jgi:hypothetical protein
VIPAVLAAFEVAACGPLLPPGPQRQPSARANVHRGCDP